MQGINKKDPRYNARAVFTFSQALITYRLKCPYPYLPRCSCMGMISTQDDYPRYELNILHI
ncbi:MAG: hypothetical protein ACXWV6_12230, partial [Chitinophagaceae bacterium]